MLLEPVRYEDTAYSKFIKRITDLVEKPIIWFREKVVLPNRQDYAWYHEKIRRVPTVDECHTDDVVCVFEADQQFKRDRMVDYYILTIMRRRFENCNFINGPDKSVCKPLGDQLKKAKTNYFMKYGELGYGGTAIDAYMKQKHRMIWERRNGPVGSKGTTEFDDMYKNWPF